MYERLLKETERYLERRKEIVVPIKQVWDAMVKQGKTGDFIVPSLMADFECLLEGDKRFQFVTGKTPRASRNPKRDDLVEHEEMEKLGFYEDQLVKLRRIAFPLPDEEESVDALDSAVSLEDLDGDLADTALLDAGSVSEARAASKRAYPPREGAGKAVSRKKVAKRARGTHAKALRKKLSPKKRKK